MAKIEGPMVVCRQLEAVRDDRSVELSWNDFTMAATWPDASCESSRISSQPDLVIGRVDAILSVLVRKWETAIRAEALEKRIAALTSRMAELEGRIVSTTLTIDTLSPEPYEVHRPFSVVLRPWEDEYMASFFDANISALGDTESDAILNLKDCVVTVYGSLSAAGEDKLSKALVAQYAVLKKHIRPV